MRAAEKAVLRQFKFCFNPDHFGEGTASIYDDVWPAFQKWESEAADQGSGLTQHQLIGALLFRDWLVGHLRREESDR